MVKAEGAIALIQANGDAVEQARLASVVEGKSPPQSVLKKLAEMQNPDGGFAYFIRDFSTVCDTVWIISWLDELGLRSGPLVDHAFDFLLSHQKQDGGWDEVKQVKGVDPPEFLLPGRVETRVWLTAYCAHWFVRFGRAEPPGSKGCPVDFLLAHRESSGRLKGYLRATWDALVLFYYHPGPDSEVFQQTLDVIQKEFAPERWQGSLLAWLISCLRDANLSGNQPFVRRCLEELMKKQRPDGSWESEDGEQYVVNATIEALQILKHYEVV